MFHFVSENAQTFARWEKCRKNENLKHSHRKKHFWEITSNFNKLEDRAILIKKFKATICCCDEQHLIRVACALNCDELTQNTGFLRSFHQFHLSTQCLRLCSLDWFNFRILIILFVDNNWKRCKNRFYHHKYRNGQLTFYAFENCLLYVFFGAQNIHLFAWNNKNDTFQTHFIVIYSYSHAHHSKIPN